MEESCYCQQCLQRQRCLWSVLLTREEASLPFRLKRRLRFRQGTTIYCESMPARGVYLLCSGSVKLTLAMQNGTDRIAAIMNSGEIFGYDSLFSSQRKFSAIARQTSDAYFIDRKRFHDLLRSNGELLWKFALSLVVSVHQAEEAFVNTSGLARERIRSALARWSLRQGQTVYGGSSTIVRQRELAQLIGISEETVSRELARLRDAGAPSTVECASKTRLF